MKSAKDILRAMQWGRKFEAMAIPETKGAGVTGMPIDGVRRLDVSRHTQAGTPAMPKLSLEPGDPSTIPETKGAVNSATIESRRENLNDGEKRESDKRKIRQGVHVDDEGEG